jgi:beta-galactosidase
VATIRALPAFLLVVGAAAAPLASQERSRVDFDRGWRFHLGDVAHGEAPTLDDSGWRVLDLPHDWSIEGEFSEKNPAGAGGGALPGGIGWYRKTFTLARTDSGRLAFIDFDGVYRNSEVWINGRYLGLRPYGYSSFQYELTPHLNYGSTPNVIAVRVDNSKQPNSRWYSGSGIYRNVWLVTTSRAHVDHWGTYVTTPQVTSSSARVHIRTTLRNQYADSRALTLRTSVVDAHGKVVAMTSSTIDTPGDSSVEVSQDLEVAGPALWSLDRPTLYRAISRVWYGVRLVDEYETPFGIRSFTFDREKGFFLNGTHVKIRGVCLHHDLGALGAAFNTRAMERQLELMKAMGANAIRTSHNPPAPELLDLADRMGIIVMDEAFDMWKMEKTPFDYHLDWDEWHVRDLTDMVVRDRNHPSVFIWSIGNEVMEQWTDTVKSAAPIALELAGIVRRLDPTRPITNANNNGSSQNPVLLSGATDLDGHNYHHQAWANLPTQFPGHTFIITEAMSALNTRGTYEQPSDSVAAYETPYNKNSGPQPPSDGHVSSYDHRYAFWGSLHETSLKLFEKYDHLSGIFIWQGIDYLGEPTPYEWPARSSYFGIVDLAGFPKDPYYLYQSEWTTRPMLHVFPHWNWTPRDSIDVWAYTNGDEVELFLNGTSLGVRRKTEDMRHLVWRVAFAPGTLHGVARTGGRVIATSDVKTAGRPVRVNLEPDRRTIRSDGKDLSFITVTVVDSSGTPVPTADNLVRFSVAGPATIVGVDNGDQVSHASLKADTIRLFNGKALVIVQSKRDAGRVTVTGTSDSLSPGAVRLSSGTP